ncbi:hypothetical protein HK097_007461 [Rhizophlyctis rosea]|uniref:Uncharacterized protein n=1 Tax=Rhizophlyctis rosea TaxID=64517 RepID=A0AAD5X4J5_9FUNG|nr:hypothetical protein HK097_007461 [Rhizophlyctis rosea]
MAPQQPKPSTKMVGPPKTHPPKKHFGGLDAKKVGLVRKKREQRARQAEKRAKKREEDAAAAAAAAEVAFKPAESADGEGMNEGKSGKEDVVEEVEWKREHE